MSLPALYELADKYRELESLASSEDLPPEVIADTLEALEGDLKEKATAVACYFRNLESVADSIDEAAKQMKTRGDRLRKRAESLKEYLKFNMLATGIIKIESPYFTVALQNNPPSVIIDDEASLPPRFMVTPPAPAARADKTAIGKAIKAGEVVPGAHTDVGQRVVIKP